MAEERPPRSFRGERPPFGDRDRRPPFQGGAGRPPFRNASDPAPAPHTLRLRDGDREIEVSGSAPFVRQVLDDLPALLAKLGGAAGGALSRPREIRMPSADTGVAAEAAAPAAPAQARLEVVGTPHDANGNGSVEHRVLQILGESRKPLAVAAIRKRLGPDISPQQVRRVLERAGNRVTASGQRPATYRLTGR